MAELGGLFGGILGQQYPHNALGAQTANATSLANTYAVQWYDYNRDALITEVRPKEALQGRVRREGECESPLDWLERRVSEMCVKL